MTVDMMIRCNNCFEEYNEELGLCPFCGYVNGEPSTDAFCLAPGTIIANRYAIGQKINSGGFGIVYKAWDKKLETVVAIKEYYPSGLVNRSPGETKVILVASRREHEFVYGKIRFLEEARNMAKFSTHKNIVNVYQYFEENNTAYIVMEFLSGKTLSEILQQQNVPLPYDYCVNIAIEVCAALRAIHTENILHRDVSPDNIMICGDGTVKLFDFGAARFSAGVENRVTVVIKPGFAPPEQYDKVNRQDPRTDIYALGATLYYAMTGIKPEESTNRKIEDLLVEPSLIDKNIPPNISTAIMRAMAVEQQYRFPNVDEFERALTNEVKTLSVEKEKRRKKRSRTWGIVLSLCIIVVALGFWGGELNRQRSDATLPDADIFVYYMISGDEEADVSKAEALSAIAQEFTNEYANVSIEFITASEDEYQNILLEANENSLPVLFESSGLTDISAGNSALLDLNDLFDSVKEQLYSEGARQSWQFPVGIDIPLIYINTSFGTVESANSIEEMQRTCSSAGGTVEISAEAQGMYEALYGIDTANYIVESAKEDFLSGNCMAYLGTSSDYFDIQKTLPGTYEVLIPNCTDSTYRYISMWSISSTASADEQTVAKSFLIYLVSELAQDYLYLQTQNQGLPILRNTLEECQEIYSELDGVTEYLNRLFVEVNTSEAIQGTNGGDTAVDGIGGN